MCVSSQSPLEVEVNGHDDPEVGGDDEGQVFPSETDAKVRVVGSHRREQSAREPDVDPKQLVVGERQEVDAHTQPRKRGE